MEEEKLDGTGSPHSAICGAVGRLSGRIRVSDPPRGLHEGRDTPLDARADCHKSTFLAKLGLQTKQFGLRIV